MDKDWGLLWIVLGFVFIISLTIFGLNYETRQEQQTIRFYIANGYQEVIIGTGRNAYRTWQKVTVVGNGK